jgi:hypothetical protein
MSIEAMKQALEALEIVAREMLALRDELAERGGRPTKGIRQLLWDSSHKVYTDTAIPTAEALRQAIEQAEKQAQHRHISYVCPQCHWSLDEQPAQQQAQPVIEVRCFGDKRVFVTLLPPDQFKDGDKFYTGPIQRQPLTKETLEAMAEAHVTNCYFDTLKFARAIEVAHGIKGEA